MSVVTGERSTQVSHISELNPGLFFEYRVWREYGPFGDVHQDRAVKVGSWIIRANVLEPKDGINQVLFDVYSEEESLDEVGILMESVGTIRQRQPSKRLPAHQYGQHPIEEKFACDIEPYSILDETGLEALNDPSVYWMCGHHAKNGRSIFLPGRNVELGTLRIIVGSAEE